MKAAISEIYASIQGEGLYTGERQIFVRFAGCPLRCDYCDTPLSLTAQGHPQMTVEEVIKSVKILGRDGGPRTVSLTGGEPLAHVQFLIPLVEKLKKEKFKLYLETAGVHPDAFKRIVKSVDVVAMDVKLPSATKRRFWSEHRQFLKLGGRKIFVKMVVEKHSNWGEIKKALTLLNRQKNPPVLVIQPVTPQGPSTLAPSPDFLSQIFELAISKKLRTLIMPQHHAIWGVR